MSSLPNPSPQPDLERLLRSAALAARSGKTVVARAIFQALSHEYPDEERVWLGLAAVAPDPAEQRQALQQALALNPANSQTQAALAQLGPDEFDQPHPPIQTSEPITPDAATLTHVPPHPDDVPAPKPEPDDDSAEQASPFPMLNLIATALIVLLLGVVGFFIGRNLLAQARPDPAPASTLVVLATPIPATAAPAITLVPTTIPTNLPIPSAVPSAVVTPGIPTALPATMSPGSPTPQTELPLGSIVDYDGWSATLLRPDFAVTLDGALGDLQPNGRFVLAVIAVSNNSTTTRLIPPDLFTLSDEQGRTYTPVPGASSAYLALYERGQRGDLALEDPFDPASGMRSVPILFDVATDATGLRLHLPGTGSAGWPISGGNPAPVGP